MHRTQSLKNSIYVKGCLVQRWKGGKLFTLVGRIKEGRWLDEDGRRKCHRDSTNAVDADGKSLLMGSKRGSEKVAIRRDPRERSGEVEVYPGFVFYSKRSLREFLNGLVDEV